MGEETDLVVKDPNEPVDSLPRGERIDGFKRA
jgi:hypothetical protein